MYLVMNTIWYYQILDQTFDVSMDLLFLVDDDK